MWFIIGLILFFIVLYIHKHTYYKVEYKKEYSKKVSTPIWLIIIALVISFIPILNIFAFFVVLGGFIIDYKAGDACFKPNGVIKKLFDFLNKEV